MVGDRVGVPWGVDLVPGSVRIRRHARHSGRPSVDPLTA
jgi:hypothetical protein